LWQIFDLDLDFLFTNTNPDSICSEMSVETIVAHPLYDEKRLLYDYAILRTKELIPFSRTVNAACLPQFTTPEVTDGKNLQISGWGKESKVYGEYKDTLILKVSFNKFSFLLLENPFTIHFSCLGLKIWLVGRVE
jgi:hypothetical protein